MALLGDIQIYSEGAFGYPGDEVYRVDSGTTASIVAGTPVKKALGGAFVVAESTNQPVVATDYWAGIAATTSNETATLPGTVRVTKMDPNLTYLIAPNAPTSWDTQAEYDALVGDRVLLDLTSSTWTILAADSATYGCVIMPLDISKHPGVVRFALRQGVNYLT